MHNSIYNGVDLVPAQIVDAVRCNALALLCFASDVESDVKEVFLVPVKKNSVRTTKEVATTASKVLKSSKSPKTTKTLAGSALSNRKK